LALDSIAIIILDLGSSPSVVDKTLIAQSSPDPIAQ